MSAPLSRFQGVETAAGADLFKNGLSVLIIRSYKIDQGIVLRYICTRSMARF
jgi:hypothetical protein